VYKLPEDGTAIPKHKDVVKDHILCMFVICVLTLFYKRKPGRAYILILLLVMTTKLMLLSTGWFFFSA
jgi:hypothetical protein